MKNVLIRTRFIVLATSIMLASPMLLIIIVIALLGMTRLAAILTVPFTEIMYLMSMDNMYINGLSKLPQSIVARDRRDRIREIAKF